MKKKITTIFLLLIVFSVQAQVDWNAKQDFPGCINDGISFSIGEIIYYGLGITCQGTLTQNFYKFDTVADTWTQLSNFPGQTRRKAASFSINGKGYVTLGASQNGVELTDLWEYDPDTDSWTQKNDFPGPSRIAAIADVLNGKAYIGTGISAINGYPLDLWEYDSVTDSWTQKATKPGFANYAACSFAMEDTLYVVGGVGGQLLEPINEFWAYTPSNDTWTQLPDFPGQERSYPSAFTLNGKGYYGTGLVGVTNLGDLWSFDPSTGDWTPLPGVPGGGKLFNGGDGGVATSNAGYFLVGTTFNNPSPTTAEVWEVLPEPLSISDLNNNTAFLLYPNPTSEELNLTAPETGEYFIYNILGKLIKKLSLNQNQTYRIDVSTWDSGVYFLSSHEKSIAINQKFVVN